MGITFEIKDLGYWKYFLGIEVLRSRIGICLSQRKYALDLLRLIGTLVPKPVDTPVEVGHKLSLEDGDLLEGAQMYRWLVDKIIFHTITRPYILQDVSMVSQYMHAPRTSNLDSVKRIYYGMLRALR